MVFSHLGFWSGSFFLIAPFPDLCLLVPFYLNKGLEFFFTTKLLPTIGVTISVVSKLNMCTEGCLDDGVVTDVDFEFGSVEISLGETEKENTSVNDAKHLIQP